MNLFTARRGRILRSWQYEILVVQPVFANQPIRVTGSTDYFMPQHMSVELTSNCNLRCIYCYRGAGPAKAAYLPCDQLIGILKALIKQGLRSVELTGGEPLLHPSFGDVLDFCAKELDRVAILSNGCLINEKVASQLGLYKEKVFVQVDLDGSVLGIHDALRGVPGAFEQTQRAIKLLAQRSVATRVAMNLTKDNVHDVENTLLLAKRLGATWFTYTPILDIGRGKNVDMTFSAEQVEHLLSLPRRLHEEHGSFYNYLNPGIFLEKFQKEKNCGAGHRVAVLGPTGKVRPCPMLAEEYLTIGDLTTQSVNEVFSNLVVAYLHNLESPNKEVCGNCERALYCRYCHTRGIVTQAKLKSPCEWARKNELAKWVSVDEWLTGETCNANAQCALSL